MKINLINPVKLLINFCLLCTLFTLQNIAHAEVKITYYIPDASGSPVAATDEEGKVLWRKHYKPFGEEIEHDAESKKASKNNHIGYTGHVHDRDTGLTYMRARYYDPVVGRFMAMDPAGVNPEDPRTFNRFAYGNNNPYKYIDPDGRNPKLLEWSWRVGWVAGEGINGAAFLITGVTVSNILTDVAWDALHNESDDGDSSNDYPADPDDWNPPDGWQETPAGEKTKGKHRQWNGPDGKTRRWDREGRKGGKERGPHWHDSDKPGEHIEPNDINDESSKDES